MLTKTIPTVVVAAIPARDYRPYGKSCPSPSPPTHAPRWVTKTLCGTVTHYLLLDGDQVVGYEHDYLINYNGNVVFDQHVRQITTPNASPSATQLAYTEPFCTQVRIYE